MENKIKKEENKSFCLAPWISAHTFPDGRTFPCCVWDIGNPIGNINDQNLKDIFNNDKLKEVRRKMLSGEKVESCSRCYSIEKNSPHSYRNKINREFESSMDLLEVTKPDGTVEKMNIKLWDFRLSNFCNLRCRSCGIDLSSGWYKDQIQLNPSLKGELKALISLNDKVSFMDMIEDQYQYVEEIYFAGGEPLMMPEHYQILDKLIQIGKTDVRVRYSTNYTNVLFKKKHIFDYWKHFKNLEILVSLDGVKEQGEYIRKGLDYNSLKTNLLELKDSNISMTKAGFVVTYGVLNYEHLFDIVIEFIKEDLIDKDYPEDRCYREVIFSPIYTPVYFDCSYLPILFKRRFLRRLNQFNLELDQFSVHEMVKKDIINRLREVYESSLLNSFDITIMKKFVSETQKLDKIRKEKFLEVFKNYSFEEFTDNSLNLL